MSAPTAPAGRKCSKTAKGPLPKPGEGEVLIEVAAAGVNRPDVMQRKGMYPPPPGAPETLGMEVGRPDRGARRGREGASRRRRGLRAVFGRRLRRICVAPAVTCLPVPKGLTHGRRPPALPETFLTVWTNVFERGG